MTRRFAVRTVPRFDRLLRHLSGRHPELAVIYAKALEILELDPHNASRTHPIRKLERRAVVLYYCGLRREDTYR